MLFYWEVNNIGIDDHLVKIKEIVDAMVVGSAPEVVDLDSVDNEVIRGIYESIYLMHKRLEELNDYSSSLAQGDLDVEFPPRQNYLVGGLKELHSNLLHLTWKVTQISQGGYNQKVDFMGQFSAAFNDMVDKLRMREAQLVELQNVAEVLFKYTNIIVFVINANTKELIYYKEKDSNVYDDSACPIGVREIVKIIRDKMEENKNRKYDWDLHSPSDDKWYAVKSMAVNWLNDQEAYFHMLFDISEQKNIQNELEIAITKDPKTGVYNNAYATEAMNELIKSRTIFSIVFFDIDGLKKINDTYGHIVGDKMIQSLIDIILGVIRREDVLCRMGGDEFLLILPYIKEDTATKVVSRIVKKTDDFNAKGENEFVLNFSYGIEFDEDVENISVRDLIDKADKKMYEQKKSKGSQR